MPTLPQDGEFGTYGERKPRIVKKSMKVGEQDVGLQGHKLAELLDEAARTSSAEVAAGEDPPATTEGPATDAAREAPDEGPASDADNAQPEAETAEQATAEESQPAAEEPPQPVEAEPVTPATDEEATGDTVTLTREEHEALKRGSLMQADYTRKTQELAALRKEAEKAQAEARAERDHYLSLIKQAEPLVAGADKEPDWGTLRQTLTPEAYANERDLWAQAQKDRAAIKAERERVEKRKAEDDAKVREQQTEAEMERLLTVMPDLRDQKVSGPWLKKVHATARSLGFTDQEFSSINDHRLFLLLNQAAKGAPVPKDKPNTTKPTISRPRSVGPGATPPTRTPQNTRDKKMDVLKQKKSVEAAGEYFATLDL